MQKVTPTPKVNTRGGDIGLGQTFVLAGLSSMVGATVVFPIDKVKTRLQSTIDFQKISPAKRIAQSLTGIFKTEGFRGLYKGLAPQLVGITPEKALKITVNDFLKRILRKREGKPVGIDLSVKSELIAGIGTGLVQVFATNPYEIVKIRMQLLTKGERRGAISIIKELGLKGLYRGLPATMMRDIPFNAIYFSSYAVIKSLLNATHGATGPIESWKLFVAGIGAGTLAAGLDTPADTIKTRLQNGKYGYKGIRDAYKSIVKNEGHSALFRGLLPRILIIAPLFSITFTVFEKLQYFLKM